MSSLREWDRRTAARLEDAYMAARAGPGGSGSTDLSEGAWRAKRQHLAIPMDGDGTWLDVGCANGHLLAPGGRLIVSSYTGAGRPPRPLFDDLTAAGHPPDGIIHIDRPGRAPLMTAWLDA